MSERATPPGALAPPSADTGPATAGSGERAPVRPVERAVSIGPARLMGIVTEPVASGGGAERPRRALLAANIGLHHRVGPFRIYVELARAAAARGWYVLRFDLSGLGESEPRPEGTGDTEQAVRDTIEAMDWMAERHGIEEFVLVGLCSGVDAAHATALVDPRVVGAAFIDGYSYRTPGHLLRRHVLRLLQLGRWRRYLGRRLAARPSAAGDRARPAGGAERAVTDPATAGLLFARRYPSRARFRQDVAALTRRGARLLFVYTGAVDEHFNSERQLAETLGRRVPRDRVAVAILRHADHVLTGLAERARLVALLVRWLDGGAPDARPAPHAPT